MSPSPISDPPSPPIAASDDADHNLQPFFVLHRALPRKREKKAPGSTSARRKIDLPSSPNKSTKKSDSQSMEERGDAVYDQLRLEAFHLTWSKIDATVKEVLRKINLELFDDVHRWVCESFSAIKSTGSLSADKIQWPYPLVIDATRKRIPTALIFTKNAEFVDDLLTFQELGLHLKSNGCHVANLTALDFSSKLGIRGCLRSLSRQLIAEAPDAADIAVLASWYCEPNNSGRPIILIIDDMERCGGAVLADFIAMLSEWVIKMPIIFIMGVTTTVHAPRKLLQSDALQHLQTCKFTLGSPCERMNALVEAVLVKPCSGFRIGHKVAAFVKNYFFRHDGTVTSFIRALKLACIKHFSMEPLSFLGPGVLDENCESSWHDKCDALPDALWKYAFDLPSCQREKVPKEIGYLAQSLSELRMLQKGWSSVVLCLFEVGKHCKMQLLDMFCEAIDPTLHNLRASDHNLRISSLDACNLKEERFSSAEGGFIAQAIQKGITCGATLSFA